MQAVAVFSLSLLAVSAAFLVNISNPITLVALVPLAVVLGFIVHISSDGFTRDSLAAVPTLAIGIAGVQVAAAAIFISVAAPLASVFAGGERFRDYFSATSIPVMAAGLALGIAAFFMLQASPQLESEAVNFTSEMAGSQVETVVDESGLVDSFMSSQKELARATSAATVGLTGEYIQNASLDPEDQAEVAEQLDNAAEEVPDTVAEEVEEGANDAPEISGQVENSVGNLLEGRMAILAIPLVAGITFGLRPIVALISAVSAKLFSRFIT